MGIEKIDESTFKFGTFGCDVRINFSTSTKVNIANVEGMKISIDENHPVHFAYEYGSGLVEIENINSKRDSNLLGALLKIKNNDINAYADFFNNYGFFFPIEKDRLININCTFLNKYIDRLKALTDLINEVGNPNTNFRKIMELSLYLLFDIGWELDINGTKLTSYHYNLADLIDNAFSNINEQVNKQDAVNKGAYTIKDSIYGTYEFDADEYNEIVNNHSSKIGYDDFLFRSVVYVYANNTLENNKEKNIIDLLFHYFTKHGIPQEITSNGVKYYSRFNSDNFDSFNMIDVVIDFGKYIISHEINHGILGIRPECDPETMNSKWVIPSLSSALYFSLFYLDKKKQMMRKCKYCGTYFIVNRSTSTKKYCSNPCRNNAQQAAHRLREKEKLQNKRPLE